MKRSLLAAIAIVPTLLVGCKKYELKGIAFNTQSIDLTKESPTEVEFGPTPSKAPFDFDKVTYTVVDSVTRDPVEDFKDYFSYELTEKEPEKPGCKVFLFKKGVKEYTSEKGVIFTAAYSGTDFTADLGIILPSTK